MGLITKKKSEALPIDTGPLGHGHGHGAAVKAFAAVTLSSFNHPYPHRIAEFTEELEKYGHNLYCCDSGV